MIANFIITSLVAVSAGIFAWLFFLQMYDKLTYYKDTVEELTKNKFSELFLFIDISNYFYYYIAALLIFPIITGSLSGDISLGILTFFVILFSPYVILKNQGKGTGISTGCQSPPPPYDLLVPALRPFCEQIDF